MKTVRETGILFIHYEKLLLRNPFWLLAALFQPICYLYLFAPLLKNVAGGGKNAITMFTPGLLVMVSMFSVMFVGFGMIDYLRAGVVADGRDKLVASCTDSFCEMGWVANALFPLRFGSVSFFTSL